MRNSYLKIINRFGYRNQMKKINEECYELIEAIDNYEDFKAFGHNDENTNKVFRSHVVEEIGDVLTLMTQFMMYYDVTKEELDEVMDYKLNRTLERIELGYYEKGDE